MIFEEDTYRVLSAGNHIREIRQPLFELQQEATIQQAYAAGSLVIRGSRWFAILHDFDQPESYRRETIEAVFTQMTNEIASREISAIAVQALGAHHGPDETDIAVERLQSLAWPDCLARIWVVSHKR